MTHKIMGIDWWNRSPNASAYYRVMDTYCIEYFHDFKMEFSDFLMIALRFDETHCHED